MGVYIVLGTVLISVGAGAWYCWMLYNRVLKVSQELHDVVLLSAKKVEDKLDKDKKAVLRWINEQTTMDVPDVEVITDDELYRRELRKARHDRDSR